MRLARSWNGTAQFAQRAVEAQINTRTNRRESDAMRNRCERFRHGEYSIDNFVAGFR